MGMFGIGKDKKKKKKPSNVFRKCRTKGYVEVYHSYLLEVSREMASKSALQDRAPGGVSRSSSSSVQMLDSLLCWMFQRKKPFWMLGVDETEWKKWIALREDHWIVDEELRYKLLKERKI